MPALTPHLSTPRLRLKLFDHSPKHYGILLASMNTPIAHRTMGDFGITTPAQFDVLLTSTRLSFFPDTDIYYLLSLPSSSVLIGGISLSQRNPRLPPDIGWCLLEPYHGSGYAAEAARELLRYMGEVGVREIMAWPGVGNGASVRTAEKVGLVYAGEIEDEEGKPALVYILPGMDFEKIKGERITMFGESGREEIVLDDSKK